MKKLFISIATIVTATCMASSCKPEKKNTFEQSTWKDSTAYALVSVSLEVPTGNLPSGTVIRQHLLSIVEGEARELCDDSTVTMAYDPAPGISLAECYGRPIAIAYNKESKEVQEFRKSTAQDGDDTTIIPYYAEIILQKELQTDKYVVFHSTGIIYTGGAHPIEHGAGHLTYSLKDGQLLEQVVDSTRLADLQPLLREGLTQYFTANGADESMKLEDMLLIDGNVIPLPAHQPYFTADGLAFEYKQYEIAPYAAGMPSFVIPYEKAKPFMTPKAKGLLSKD